MSKLGLAVLICIPLCGCQYLRTCGPEGICVTGWHEDKAPSNTIGPDVLTSAARPDGEGLIHLRMSCPTYNAPTLSVWLDKADLDVETEKHEWEDPGSPGDDSMIDVWPYAMPVPATPPTKHTVYIHYISARQRLDTDTVYTGRKVLVSNASGFSLNDDFYSAENLKAAKALFVGFSAGKSDQLLNIDLSDTVLSQFVTRCIEQRSSDASAMAGMLSAAPDPQPSSAEAASSAAVPDVLAGPDSASSGGGSQ